MPLQVLSWGSIVLRWLYVTAQHSAANQRALTIEAFAAWVRLGLLYEQNLPSQEVQGLLTLTFQCLLQSSESKLDNALQHSMLLSSAHIPNKSPRCNARWSCMHVMDDILYTFACGWLARSNCIDPVAVRQRPCAMVHLAVSVT